MITTTKISHRYSIWLILIFRSLKLFALSSAGINFFYFTNLKKKKGKIRKEKVKAEAASPVVVDGKNVYECVFRCMCVIFFFYISI